MVTEKANPMTGVQQMILEDNLEEKFIDWLRGILQMVQDDIEKEGIGAYKRKAAVTIQFADDVNSKNGINMTVTRQLNFPKPTKASSTHTLFLSRSRAGFSNTEQPDLPLEVHEIS